MDTMTLVCLSYAMTAAMSAFIFTSPVNRWSTYLITLSNATAIFPIYLTFDFGYYFDSILIFATMTTGMLNNLSGGSVTDSIVLKSYSNVISKLDYITTGSLIIRCFYLYDLHNVSFDLFQLFVVGLGILLACYSNTILGNYITLNYIGWSEDLFDIWTHILATLKIKLTPKTYTESVLLYVVTQSLSYIILYSVVGWEYQEIIYGPMGLGESKWSEEPFALNKFIHNLKWLVPGF